MKLDASSFLVTLFMAAVPELFGRPRTSGGFFAPARTALGAPAVEAVVAVLRVMGVFVLVSLFWALFDQHGSTWIDQAELMDGALTGPLTTWLFIGAIAGVLIALAVGLTVPKAYKAIGYAGGFAVGMGGMVAAYFGFQVDGIATLNIDPSQMSAANPMMVMILIPITLKGIYPLMARLGFEPHPLRKMTVGMFMAALSFVAAAVLQLAIRGSAEHSVHMLWQVIPYMILTTAEVMVSITGLEFGYSQAPKHMKSVVMGFWMLTVAIGNWFASKLFGGLKGWDLIDFFWLFTGLMAGAAVAFAVIASFYKYKDVIQGEDGDVARPA